MNTRFKSILFYRPCPNFESCYEFKSLEVKLKNENHAGTDNYVNIELKHFSDVQENAGCIIEEAADTYKNDWEPGNTETITNECQNLKSTMYFFCSIISPPNMLLQLLGLL